MDEEFVRRDVIVSLHFQRQSKQTYLIQICPDTVRRGADTSRCNSTPAGSCRAARSETHSRKPREEENHQTNRKYNYSMGPSFDSL